MGNSGSSGNHGRRRNANHSNTNANPSPTPNQPQPEISTNRYVFAAATPYPNPNSTPYYQYAGFYPPPPPPLPAPFDHHHRNGLHQPNWAPNGVPNGHAGRYPCVGPHGQPVPYVEHQKAVTIKNDVNLKKESLRVEPDESNPGNYLIAFTFDALVAGSITVYFFAKEGIECNLTATKENLLNPFTISFEKGLGQNFIQPSGTGIDFSMFNEVELMKEGKLEIYPIAVKAEASSNSQITQAVFEMNEKGEYQVRAMKQILWVNDTRYELQEIYGIGNSVDSDFDGNDPGKECVICLSEPRDTTVLPCRHMCLCSGCAKVLRFQTNRCPICRQLVERLLAIQVNSQTEEQQESDHP